MDERKNFYLVYKEALNNIAKYADGKNVWIEMTMNHYSIYLETKMTEKDLICIFGSRVTGLSICKSVERI